MVEPAARALEKEQKKELGKVLFDSHSLRNRYRRRKKGKTSARGRDEFGRFVKGNIPWDNRFQGRNNLGRFSQSPAVKEPESGDIKEPPEPISSPKKRGRHPRYTVAMDLATITTSQLSRIEVDDPKREIAFERVIIWITENRYGRKGDSAW
jgi:hypothetical protein